MNQLLSDYVVQVFGDGASNENPKAPGNPNPGKNNKLSRDDHVHPAQESVIGNAGTATKLAGAVNVITTLSSTSPASFDGSAGIEPGVTGTLAVANGGTGQTTIAGLKTSLGLDKPVSLDSGVTGTLAVANGGTGQTTIAGLKTSLGLDKPVSLDSGVTGTLAVANGGTGATTAEAALLALNGVKKTGSRGELSGSEIAKTLTGNQTITVDSGDSINIDTTGNVSLTFVPADANISAVKVISLNAVGTTALTVSGASWANKGQAPTWGNAGKILVLVAHFVGGRVVLLVTDNTQ